jgi:exosortase/archaeosortase family protein
VKFQKDWLLLLGSLFVAGALYNHYLGHSALLVEIILVAIGIGMALYAARSTSLQKKEAVDGLLIRLMGRFMSREFAASVIPMLGFAVLLVWSIWKIFVIQMTDLHMEDFIVTLLGLSLVLYNFGPSKLHQMQDFVVFYLMFLTLVFVGFWKLYEIFSGESSYRITAYAEYYIVTQPTTTILNLMGFDVSCELRLGGIGLANIIEYEYGDRILRLGIGAGCSGLYSAGLFFSAFLAFVFVRYQKVDRYIGAALALGFVVTWLSNIVRMVFTVMAGIMWGHPALAFVHSYIGIVIFVVFITIFWLLIVRWLDAKEPKVSEAPLEKGAPVQG